jgi:hypothetical protein
MLRNWFFKIKKPLIFPFHLSCLELFPTSPSSITLRWTREGWWDSFKMIKGGTLESWSLQMGTHLSYLPPWMDECFWLTKVYLANHAWSLNLIRLFRAFKEMSLSRWLSSIKMLLGSEEGWTSRINRSLSLIKALLMLKITSNTSSRGLLVWLRK